MESSRCGPPSRDARERPKKSMEKKPAQKTLKEKRQARKGRK
jgi:hypothetical protein